MMAGLPDAAPPVVSAPGRPLRLALLPNPAMRARRCLSAIAAWWAWQAIFGAAMAWPMTALARAAYGSQARADAVLWEPEGFALLDLVVRRLPVLGGLVAHAATILLFSMVLGLLPASALFVCVGFASHDAKSPTVRQALLAAIPALGPSAALFATALVFEVSLGAAALAGAGLAQEGFQRTLGDVAADGVALFLVVMCAAIAAVAGVLQEVARAAVVRFGLGAREGLRKALRALATAPVTLLWSWAWRALASVVPVGVGALLAWRLGGRGGVSLVVLLVMHQMIIVVRTALRASWFARAMRAVDSLTEAG